MVKVLGKVAWITAERINYKPYSPRLSFDDVYVEVEIPDSEVTQKPVYPDDPNSPTINVLTLKGFTTLLDTLATSVDEMHSAYMRRATQ